jgi:membrane-bound metal-dependent hydrolase YbcI (DUF457 family)
MPITPFHFGPGAAIHSLAPRRISFAAFCAANVLTDVEPLYYMVTQQFPLHRFFHTYVGATVMGVLTLALLLLLRRWVQWQATPAAIAVGAFIGTWSHVVLDSIMHTDITPLAPFSEANGLWHIISLVELHLYCLLAGLVGAAILGLRKSMRS